MIVPSVSETHVALQTAETLDELWSVLAVPHGLHSVTGWDEAHHLFCQFHGDDADRAVVTALLLCTDARWRKDEFLRDPSASLTEARRQLTFSSEPLTLSIGPPDNRPYGSFLFAEYLEKQFGPTAILSTWEGIGQGDSRNALEVIRDFVEDPDGIPGTPDGLDIAHFVPAFWTAAYTLDDGVPTGVPGFQGEPDVQEWVAALTPEDPEDRLPEVQGDSFNSRARAGRARDIAASTASPLTVPNTGQSEWVDVKLEAGGSAIFDLQLEPGYKGDLTSIVVVDPAEDYAEYAATFIAWETASGGASGFPGVCERAGLPVLVGGLLESPVGWSEVVELDEDCSTGTLIVTRHEVFGDGEREISVRFSVDEEPMPPPGVDATATIDGPGVTGLWSGQAVGIVSDPPEAGPTGDLCVNVTVHATWFLFNTEVDIELFDPFTGDVLERISWPEGTITQSPQTFNLGPAIRNPWTPLAVRVTETNPELISWGAYPASC